MSLGESRAAPARFPNLRIVEHARLADALARLRDAGTPRAEFRRALDLAARLLAAEATRDLPRVATGASAGAGLVDGAQVTLVPILRAGLGMQAAALALVPGAAIGYVGLERAPETRLPRQYYAKLPPDPGGPVLVLDPMIATGGSAAHTLDLLRARGIAAERTRLLGLVAAPEGIATLLARHPDVAVFTAALDEGLDADKQIVPGIGDAGDRLFGTT